LTLHLSSRMCVLSPGATSLRSWLEESCPSVFRASHSPSPESGKASKMNAGFSTPSQTALQFCVPEPSSQKMSRGCCPQKCQTAPSSSPIASRDWKRWVTGLRQEYLARRKQALLTREKECSSSAWPTITSNESRNTACPSQFQRNSPPLGTAVVMEDWPTPTVQEGGKIGNQPNHRQKAISNHPAIVGVCAREKMEKSGLLAPDNPNTGGSLRESASWPTASVSDAEGGPQPKVTFENGAFTCEKVNGPEATFGAKLRDAVEMHEKNWATPNTMDCLPSRSYEAMKKQATNGGRKNRSRPGNLREQIDPLMCQAYKDAQVETNSEKSWATPQAFDCVDIVRSDLSDAAKQGGCANLREQVHAGENWSTPRAGATDNSRPNNKGGIPLGDQVRRCRDSNWATPQASDHIEGARTDLISKQKCLGRDLRETGDIPKQWPTATVNDCSSRGSNSAKNGPDNILKKYPEWATPQSRDHKEGGNPQPHGFGQIDLPQQAGRGKLNPRWVETLMGLTVGWVMPNCGRLGSVEYHTRCDNRTDELRLLGNGVVPTTAAKAFSVLAQKVSGEFCLPL